MFQQGARLNFRVIKGLPGDVEILSGEVDWKALNFNLTVRGFFEQGADGEIFDIILTENSKDA